MPLLSKFNVRSSTFKVLPLLLQACSPSAPTSPPQIALVLKSLTTEPTATLVQKAIAHQAAHPTDYTLIIKGIDNTTDLAAQVHHIDQLATNGIQALIISPADPSALIPALTRAAAQGIRILTIDTPLTASDLPSAFIGPDNQTAAHQIGLALAKKRQPGDPVAIIHGPPADLTSQQRRTGLETALRETQLQIVAIETANNNLEQANALTQSLISQHPNLKAILCTSDTMALGAASAIQAARKTSQILVTGFDHIPAIQPLIANGQVTATADPHTTQLAVTAIETALKSLQTQTPPTPQTTPVDLITK
jgi:ribose transport system substrate-binding protein